MTTRSPVNILWKAWKEEFQFPVSVDDFVKATAEAILDSLFDYDYPKRLVDDVAEVFYHNGFGEDELTYAINKVIEPMVMDAIVAIAHNTNIHGVPNNAVRARLEIMKKARGLD